MLRQEIQKNLNTALKERKEIEVSVLRMFINAILNKEKEKTYKQEKETSLNDEEIIDILSSEIKKRNDSVSAFEKGNRMDLAEKEKTEIEILKKYLPEQISEDEIKRLVKIAVEKTGAKEIKDMGKVMAELMPQTKGKADSGLVSKIVKELLND